MTARGIPAPRTIARPRRRPVAALALFAAVLVGSGLPTAGASAQQGAEISRIWLRIDRLEREIAALGRQMAGRGRGAGVAGSRQGMPAAGPAAARLEARLSALEQELRAVTGRIEELDYRVRQLDGRLTKAISDLEFRVSRLEQPGGAATPAAQPPPPGVLGTMPKSEAEALRGQAGPQAAPREAPAPAGARVALPEGPSTEQYAYAFGLLRKADYEGAEAALSQFLAAHPTDPLADNARYWLGETYYVRGDYVRAAEAFLDAYKRNKKGPKAADALLKLGMSLSRLGKKSEACTTFREISRAVPKASARIKKKVADEKRSIGCK